MCGICCLFQDNSVTLFEDVLTNSSIKNRGPDFYSSTRVEVCSDTSILFGGFVLHLRGEGTPQPLRDDDNNVLLWNGEIFDGFPMKDGENDTKALFDRLVKIEKDQELLDTMSSIKGPWAFIFWQASSRRLWFGRDVFGRRSLLWHLPDSQSDVFALSSVQIKPHKFEEIKSVGLYCAEFGDSHTETQGIQKISVYPWKNGTWPGSQQKVVTTPQEEVPSLLYAGPTVFVLSLNNDLDLPSWMPKVNSELPPLEHPSLKFESTASDNSDSFKDHLRSLFDDDEKMKTCVKQLIDVLTVSVRRRVMNLPRGTKCANGGSKQEIGDNLKKMKSSTSDVNGEVGPYHTDTSAHVAILFSGGIDSTVLAALADRCVPEDEAIDLINVAFEQQPKQPQRVGKKEKQKNSNSVDLPGPPVNRFDVPDRLTGYIALSELNPNRRWNFVEVNVTEEELKNFRSRHISELIYPLVSVLDDSIGCAIWFAARGRGILGNGPHKGQGYESTAKVILCGMGADEQLVGYSRHMARFRESGWSGVIKEIDMEMRRISARNLGRDDRIIGDHGRESRIPFLDEDVVAYLASLPLHQKANLSLPRGLGEKLILRVLAVQLGLHNTAIQPKRAIQFGSRIAKLENRKEKASDVCKRLQNSAQSGAT